MTPRSLSTGPPRVIGTIGVISSPFVRIDRVGRSFTLGDRVVRALDQIDLVIAAGEFLAVTGPSGSGKSTLLNLIGGLDRPTDGRVLVQDRDLAHLSSDELARYRRERVGFVFQAFRLIPDLTALENAALPLVLDGATEADAEGRARPLLERVGLRDRLGHVPSRLSAGEQQRVALARALVNQPALLLADEPTANLDVDSASALLGLVDELRRERRITVVLATHDRELASRADRSILLGRGRRVSGGPALP